MNFKNLTPKNKNTLLIGIAIVFTVATMMVGYFTTKKSALPEGTNLQGLLNIPIIPINQLPPSISCKGELLEKKAGPNDSMIATVKWTVTTVGTPGGPDYSKYKYHWSGSRGIIANIYPSPKTVQYAYKSSTFDETVSVHVKWINESNGSVAAEGDCSIHLQNSPASGQGGGINLPNIPKLPPLNVPVVESPPADNPPADNNPAENQADQNPPANDPNAADPNLFNDGSTPVTPGELSVLQPAEDILSCNLLKKSLVLSQSEKIALNCALKKAGLVTAFIVNGPYDPSQDPVPENVVKNFFKDTSYTPVDVQTPFHFILPFDGKKYDSPVDPGDYTFVVSAVPDQSYEPDFSIIKFKVLQDAPAEEVVEPTPAPEPVLAPAPVSPKPANPVVKNPTPPLHAAAPVEMSKCHTPYPTDIAGHWAEGIIKNAYDLCIMKGFADGKAHPDQAVTRAEAVKLGLSVAGIQPKLGCTGKDCGSGFLDLQDWQGPWVSVAQQQKFVKGYNQFTFAPNTSMTRAEAASFIVRLFHLPIPNNCYDAHCGAGYDNNIFYDIVNLKEGYFIRSLWDLGVQSGKDIIHGSAPHTFEPGRPVTRAEILKILMNVKEAKLAQ